MNLLDKKLTEALPVLETLNENGYEAYFVGGCVRNLLLKLPLTDVDITTSALPDEVEQVFCKTVPVGKEHGTILVLHDGNSFEVTTFRSEGDYADHRRPDEVVFVRDLTEDLLRRDFTINALAMDKEGNITDITGGIKDLDGKLIRAAGIAAERFSEDALRMLRAARFQSVLDFTIEDATYKALSSHHELLSFVSVERIVIELKKLLAGKRPDKGLETLVATGLIKSIPVMNKGTLVYPVHAVTFESYMGYINPSKQDISLLKLSGEEKRKIQQSHEIFSRLNNPDIMLCYDYDEALIKEALNLLKALNQPAEFQFEQPLIASRDEMDINGRDLMLHLNANGGPWLKEALRSIEVEIVSGRLTNQKNEILKWVKSNVKI